MTKSHNIRKLLADKQPEHKSLRRGCIREAALAVLLVALIASLLHLLRLSKLKTKRSIEPSSVREPNSQREQTGDRLACGENTFSYSLFRAITKRVREEASKKMI